jgi:hypothetical protein
LLLFHLKEVLVKRITNHLPSRVALLARLYFGTVLIATAPAAFSQDTFVPTIEPPGIQNQQSPLAVNEVNYGAVGVHLEDFNRTGVAPGPSPAPQINIRTAINFAGQSSIGTYSPAVVRSADSFGGANGTAYMTVHETGLIAGAPVQTTITFTSEQRYFGLWWSAGDPHNVLEFFHGTQLLFDFTTAKVITFLDEKVNPAIRADYFGNPNLPLMANGQRRNVGEPYAFLNFFADPNNPVVTFDKVILTNDGPTGFESDNHTIAASYEDITGEFIVPQPDLPPDTGPGGTDIIDPPSGTDDIDEEVIIDDGGMGIIGGFNISF